MIDDDKIRWFEFASCYSKLIMLVIAPPTTITSPTYMSITQLPWLWNNNRTKST